jgi:hypothetical protein
MSRMSLFRMRMMPIIASIAAHTHAIAIMAFMNAFLPGVLQAPFVLIGLAGLLPAGTTVL